MPGASLFMRNGTVPPAGIGLLACLLTTAGAVALTPTGILPSWRTTTLVLLAGGLASGLVILVRSTWGP